VPDSRTRLVADGYDAIGETFTDLELPAGSFDAVVSFYVFNHVARELLTAFGQSGNPGWTGDWLGAPTFFASYLPETNSRLVREAGVARFQWVLAQA
jgi:hypothetical protein